MQPCSRPGCPGLIEDGYCNHCGHQATTPVAAAVAPPEGSPGPPGGAGLPGGAGVGDGVGTACRRDGCGGSILDGYCDNCGLAPAHADPVSAASGAGALARAGAAASGARTGSGSGGSGSGGSGSGGVALAGAVEPAARVTGTPSGSQAMSAVGPTSGRLPATTTGDSAGMQSSRGNLGAGLVEVPSISGRDPMSAVLSEPEVPERKRMCARCSEPVGRSHDGQPGRTEGYCTHCGSAFSFSPKLWPGDLVAGQYQVAGCIAHGGLGWIYLARDRNVSDRWVVLKGLLDSEDASAMAAAIAEQKFLAEVEHPNIVKIYNFVQHADAGYIVMEYVGGDSLREIRNRHREVHGAPLPVAQSIAYILEVLPAFGYLHRRGLLFCDFKPDNVIQTEEQLRLLDLGGVRAVDDQDSDLYGTVGYQAPEVPDQGASVPSDLYTVGRTLAVLSLDIPGFQDERRHAFQLPSADQVPAFRRYESFHQFMLKATAPDPAARFQSAADMADQLLGVLRQVIAVDGGEPPPARSSHFSGALGQGVLRSSWSDLPVPVVDPFDPAAGLVAAAAMAGPDQVLAMLETAPRTPESAFALARTLIEEGRTDEALDALESPEAGPGGWRNAWWRGVLHLAASRPADALSFLSVVAAELPGELAPRLALAVSYEQAADHSAGAEGGPGAGPAGVSHALDSAGRYFDLVAGTNPTFAGACFGLARVRSAQGDRAGGVAALQRIPGSSSSHLDAQVALVRLLTREVGGAAPSLADLTSASEVIARMAVEPSVRLPLVADLLLQALDMLLAGRVQPDPTVVLVSTPLDEHELRGALERTYRSLANLAPTDEERFELVDRANAWRPRTMT